MGNLPNICSVHRKWMVDRRGNSGENYCFSLSWIKRNVGHAVVVWVFWYSRGEHVPSNINKHTLNTFIFKATIVLQLLLLWWTEKLRLGYNATPNCNFYEAKLSVCDHFSTQKIKFTSCQISWLLQTVLLNCFALLWNYKHFKTAAKRIEIWTKQAAVQVIQTVTQKKNTFKDKKNK